MILRKENDNVKNFNDFTSKLPYIGKEGKIILEETINTKEPFATYIEANIVIQKQLIQFMQIIID